MENLWAYLEKKSEAEYFMDSKFEDMEYQYKNCFVFSLAKYLIASRNPISQGKTPYHLMDYIRQEYTEKPIELQDKYLIAIKNGEKLNTDADSVLIVKNEITKTETDYINQFSYCLILVEYEKGPTHWEFKKKNEEVNISAKNIVLYLKK